MRTESPVAELIERAYVMAPRGDLDLLAVGRLQAALDELPDGCAVVVLDLGGLSFIDVSGHGLVLDAHRRLGARGVRFALVRGNGDIQRLFALARTEDRLPFFDDLGAALAGG